MVVVERSGGHVCKGKEPRVEVSSSQVYTYASPIRLLLTRIVPRELEGCNLLLRQFTRSSPSSGNNQHLPRQAVRASQPFPSIISPLIFKLITMYARTQPCKDEPLKPCAFLSVRPLSYTVHAYSTSKLYLAPLQNAFSPMQPIL